MTIFLSLLLTAVFTAPVPHPPVAQTPDAPPGYLYKVTLVRAAPGKLLDLIALQKVHQATYAERGDLPPFWMRHSQGDQWDLMLLFPMADYDAYYHPDRIAPRRAQTATGAAFDAAWAEHVAWQEDLFVYGPDVEQVRAAFTEAAFYHVEMFQALPGLRAKLYEQREMENAYLAALDRPQNLIFVRDQGAAWDLFTLGFYRDIKHFAESADIPLAQEDAAARAAGFESVYAISPYLRSLIQQHHDTLAVAIR